MSLPLLLPYPMMSPTVPTTTTLPSPPGFNEFRCLRGNLNQSEDALKAQLGLLVRMKNLVVLLGAGASCAAGGKTNAQIWKAFSQKSKASADFLAAFMHGLRSKDQKPPSATLGTPDIELLFDRINAVLYASDFVPLPTVLLEDLKKAKSLLLAELLDAVSLDQKLWKTEPDPTAQALLQTHSALLVKLLASRGSGMTAPWLFTTNYDMAIEWAAEKSNINIANGFMGTHRRSFQPQSFDYNISYAASNGRSPYLLPSINLVKLHGSLCWVVSDNKTSVVELPSTMLHDSYFNNDAVVRTQAMEDCAILPTTAKYMQSTQFVFAEQFRRLHEALSAPNTGLLVCGYSFSDKHLNRFIWQGLNNPSLHAVVYSADGDTSSWPTSPELRHLQEQGLPNLTIVGSGTRAWLQQLVRDLPEPAFLDDSSAKINQAIKQLGSISLTPLALEHGAHGESAELGGTPDAA